MIENLRDIKVLGMEKFLAYQEKKWTCPNCGGVISCHHGFCFNCELEDLKKKKKKEGWTE
jgi:ribosomal protein S27AE